MHARHLHALTARPMTLLGTGQRLAERAGRASDLFAGFKAVLGAESCEIAIVPGPSPAAWQSALSLALKPGDCVLVIGTDPSTAAWAEMATQHGLRAETVDPTTAQGDAAQALSRRLGKDRFDEVKAVYLCEGGPVTAAAVRRVLDENFHDALLLVESASALESGAFEMDGNEIDIAVATGRGNRLSPMGLTVLALSPRARPALQIAAE